MNMEPTQRGLRGFAWRLAPLQRKLEWEVEEARTQLSKAYATAGAADEALSAAEISLDQGSQDARGLVAAQADPRAHRRILGWLVSLGDQVAVARAKQEAAAEQLAAARQEVLRRQRRLDALLRARENALAAHVRDEARGQQAEADAAWLVLQASRRQDGGMEIQA